MTTLPFPRIELPATSPLTKSTLRSFRKAYKLNQTTFAELCMKDQSTVSRWENGVVPIPQSMWYVLKGIQSQKLNESCPESMQAIKEYTEALEDHIASHDYSHYINLLEAIPSDVDMLELLPSHQAALVLPLVLLHLQHIHGKDFVHHIPEPRTDLVWEGYLHLTELHLGIPSGLRGPFEHTMTMTLDAYVTPFES